LVLPTHKTTDKIINPNDTSYETIWAEERKPPKNAYFEFELQPDKITPYTPKEDTANKNKRPVSKFTSAP
jgi:hypothetical protein